MPLQPAKGRHNAVTPLRDVIKRRPAAAAVFTLKEHCRRPLLRAFVLSRKSSGGDDGDIAPRC